MRSLVLRVAQAVGTRGGERYDRLQAQVEEPGGNAGGLIRPRRLTRKLLSDVAAGKQQVYRSARLAARNAYPIGGAADRVQVRYGQLENPHSSAMAPVIRRPIRQK